MPLPKIHPCVLNTACPWASAAQDLQDLFDCRFTGAVTIRTSLLEGFNHNPDIHQYTFFNAQTHSQEVPNVAGYNKVTNAGGSLNTIGYSPVRLNEYLQMIPQIIKASKLDQESRDTKPFIISVTGHPEAVVQCYRAIHELQQRIANPLCMEVNLSCPNIPDLPPPAYSRTSLFEYLQALGKFQTAAENRRVAFGIKVPPYTYSDQFSMLIEALKESSQGLNTLDFITSTNTLGSCLVLGIDDTSPALCSSSGSGIGGMAGTPIHPLSLGNVRTIRKMLDEHEELARIDIIGVGGVSDEAGLLRMLKVGARVVGVATALGKSGVAVFESLLL